MTARTLMVQGTASSVGKSLLVTALCRLFLRDGFRVAPFKAQNMALNSAVTPDGLEIGRAQAVQAQAAGLAPCVEMNPILLKPEGDRRSQVVVLGRSIGSMSAVEYHEHKPQLTSVIARALAKLRSENDVVVIEGAGSPAEVNLKARDIVNMHVAKLAGAPVLLAGDIDRGGVLAAIVGTLELLDPDERALVAGLVINKFRGDVALLEPGLEFLRQRTGKPVLGVVPYVPALRIADEDSVSLDRRMRPAAAASDVLDICVIRLPRISNYDDFTPLEHEPGVALRFVERPEALAGADLVVLPGSKCTIADLEWLRETRLAEALEQRARSGAPLLGVCGGCQMLGEWIEDPDGLESDRRRVPGLALLPLTTRFERPKLTAQTRARLATPSFLTNDQLLSNEVEGYEIHMGRVSATAPRRPAFTLASRNGAEVALEDGAVSANGALVGTLLHGLFENEAIRSALIAGLRARKGLTPGEHPSADSSADSSSEFDRLESVVRASLDLPLLYSLVGLEPPR